MLFKKSILAIFLVPAHASPAPNDRAVNQRDLTSCNGNIVLALLSVLQASAFCTEYLGLRTQTSTVRATRTTVLPTTVTIPSTETSLFTTTTQTIQAAPETITTTVERPAETIVTTTTAFATAFITTYTTSTSTEYLTSLQYTRDLRKREETKALKLESRQADRPTVHKLDARLQIPTELQFYHPNIISTACGCYVTAGTTSTTVTDVQTSYSISTSVTLITVSSAVETSTSTSFVTATETSTRIVPDSTGTSTFIITETTTTETITSITTAVATETANATEPRPFIRTFYGLFCDYFHFDHDEQILGEEYTTEARLFQVCAARCDFWDCKSFFAYEDRSLKIMWCKTDSIPYDAQYVECGKFYSGRSIGYNSTY